MDAHGKRGARRTLAPPVVVGEDRGWVPAPVEDNSESVWAEYDACWQALEVLLSRRPASRPIGLYWTASPRLRDHQLAAELVQGAHAPPRAPAQLLSVDEVMHFARADDRVCPIWPAWRLLYQLLPVDAVRGERAPSPIDRQSWSGTPDLLKRLRLREQLEWAHARGALAPVWSFLRQLHEAQWHRHRPLAWPSLPGCGPA